MRLSGCVEWVSGSSFWPWTKAWPAGVFLETYKVGCFFDGRKILFHFEQNLSPVQLSLAVRGALELCVLIN
jgi:hypothetical protein